MKKWPIRVSRGIAMGLGWGAAWVPAALLVALIVDPNDSMDEPWLLVGMLPASCAARSSPRWRGSPTAVAGSTSCR
jgi:hypothetical protein